VQSPENIRRGIKLLADAVRSEISAPQLTS
jgi:hypothetical protein